MATNTLNMNCSPKCPYFPDVYCTEWKYDETQNAKVRKEHRDYICGYDGHIIKSWYSSCPKKEEQKENKND